MPSTARSPRAAVVGTISTAICAPLRASNARELLLERRLLLRGERAGEIGDARFELRQRDCCACARAAQARDSRQRERTRQRALSRRSRQFAPASGVAARGGACHRRRRLRRRRLVPKSTVGAVEMAASFSHGEIRLHLEAEHLGGEVGRERAHRHVVVLHRLDVAVARHGDAVLRALELRLQVAEVLRPTSGSDSSR